MCRVGSCLRDVTQYCPYHWEEAYGGRLRMQNAGEGVAAWGAYAARVSADPDAAVSLITRGKIAQSTTFCWSWVLCAAGDLCVTLHRA